MIRIVFCAALLAPGAAVAAQSKEEACALQGEVIGAIQQARLERVREADVIPTIFDANPGWPASMKEALPPMVSWVYAMKRRDLRGVDLGPVTVTQCLENWNALQQLGKN